MHNQTLILSFSQKSILNILKWLGGGLSMVLTILLAMDFFAPDGAAFGTGLGITMGFLLDSGKIILLGLSAALLASSSGSKRFCGAGVGLLSLALFGVSVMATQQATLRNEGRKVTQQFEQTTEFKALSEQISALKQSNQRLDANIRGDIKNGYRSRAKAWEGDVSKQSQLLIAAIGQLGQLKNNYTQKQRYPLWMHTAWSILLELLIAVSTIALALTRKVASHQEETDIRPSIAELDKQILALSIVSDSLEDALKNAPPQEVQTPQEAATTEPIPPKPIPVEPKKAPILPLLLPKPKPRKAKPIALKTKRRAGRKAPSKKERTKKALNGRSRSTEECTQEAQLLFAQAKLKPTVQSLRERFSIGPEKATTVLQECANAGSLIRNGRRWLIAHSPVKQAA